MTPLLQGGPSLGLLNDDLPGVSVSEGGISITYHNCNGVVWSSLGSLQDVISARNLILLKETHESFKTTLHESP
jgi:hypothetical protein